MAWRIDHSVLSGTMDFTVRGTVTGSLVVEGRDEPVVLKLAGLPWADLAGHRIAFVRKGGATEPLKEGFASEQEGSVGDMTASRKVKTSPLPIEEILDLPREEVVWNWANCLYLEWFSERNGRVVLESIEFDLAIDPVGAWELGPFETPGATGQPNPFLPTEENWGDFEAYLPAEDNTPKSEAEIEADREAARMDLLLDRISRRLDEEGEEEGDFERILEEERERLRIESGEPEPEPLTPEEEAERQRWIEEMNALAEEEDEFWEDEEEEEEEHPLVEQAFVVGSWLWHDLVERTGGGSALPPEHPFVEIANGVQSATAKLAGALNGTQRSGEWPPDPLFAGNILVRLKKARGHLHDSLAGARAAEEDGLLGGIRLHDIRAQIDALLKAVEGLVAEVRGVME